MLRLATIQLSVALDGACRRALPHLAPACGSGTHVSLIGTAQHHASGLVALRIGARSWRLRVFGDRRWGSRGPRTSIRPAAPFEAMPITWENAFGGPAFDANPVGKGHRADPTEDPDSLWLPNIEDPDNLIRHPSDRPAPACWLAVPATFPVRRNKLGSTDAHWLSTRWPELPDDFDASFWDDAAPGMRLPELRGDEALSFENLHPDNPEYESQLPGIRPRLFALDTSGERPTVHEVSLRIARLAIDLHEETFELLWQGPLPESVQAHEHLGAPQLIMEEEQLTDEPRPFEHYESKILAEQVTRRDAPVVSDASEADNDNEDELDPDVQQAVDKALAECREALVKANADPTLIAMLSGGMPDPDLLVAKLRELYPLDEQKLEAIKEEQRRQLRKGLEEQGHDPAIADQLYARDNDDEDEDPGLTRQEVVARHQRGESLAEEDLSGIDLSNLDLPGIDLRGAILTGANLTASNLARADLRQASLSGAKLVQCQLTQAQLDDADLTDANLEEANVALASAKRAKFARARLVRALFDQTDASGASFDSADLTRLHGEDLDLREAQLPRTRLDGAMLRGADLRHASLEGATGERTDLREAKLEELRADTLTLTAADLKGAHAARSMWPGATLAQVALIGVDLQGADLRGSDLRAANLTGADLRGSDLSGSDLSGAKLSGANLMRCDLREANLEDTDLRDSNLYAAETLRSRRKGIKLDRALLAQSKLSPDAPKLPPGV